MGSKRAPRDLQRPAPHDIQVHLQGSHGVRLQFFQTPERAYFTQDDEGVRWLQVDFREGGTWQVRHPTVLWIEPARH